mmetsp:Transcript_108857/g.209167  ORF Transcript_108857/g.209167 Transcript_108857/m.209167 type:complete len:581 (+) Transcript_108857:99-1841(+)
MTHCNAPKDIIAEHVRQLLDLDEGRQRAQLASLSTYAAMKHVSKGYGVNAGTSRPNSKKTGVSSASASTYGGSRNGGSSNGGSGQDGQEPSSDSPESSGSEGIAKNKATDGAGTLDPSQPAFAPGLSLGTQGEASTSQQLQELQHSTDLLKAALANWEACLQTEEVGARAQPIKKVQQAPAAEEKMPAKIAVQSLKSAAPSPTSALAGAASASDVNSDALAINALQKALSDLTSSLSADTAQQFLQQEGQRHQEEMARKAQEEENLKAVKWLRQHLEKQQEESMMKIFKMMQSEQKRQDQKQSGLDAMAACFTPAASQGYGGMWPPMMNPALVAAQCSPLTGQPMFPPLPAGAMPGAFGMPPMVMESGMPWAHMGMPASSSQINTHARRQFAAQPARQQGQHQRNGAHESTPGANGNASRKSRPVPPAGIEEETLRTHLRELQKVEPEKVVLVRKINRLGFESPAALRTHYSKYGKVEKVLVAHSHVKSQNRRFAARLRPSGLGFVVMSKKEEADAILAEGPEQVVAGGPDHAGAAIRVQRFQRRSEDAKDGDLKLDDEEQDDQEDGDAAEALACEGGSR